MENGGPAEEAKMFHPIPDDYDGDGLSSVASFAASSSFSSSVGGFSDHVDCRDRPWQSEVEEIPSFRWLTSPSPVPKPPRSEVDKVAKQAGDVHSSYRAEYADLKAKTERLVALLQEAARADLYDDRRTCTTTRPTRRIMDDTLQVLEKAQALISKWSAHRLLKRVFTINPAAAFKEMSAQLDDSIGDVSWLLRVSATRRHGSGDHDDDGYLGLPPIAFNEPILFLIWQQLAKLHNGSPDDRAEAAASLVSLARDNERNGKLIIEEGGVGPLLKLVMEGQEHAAEAIGLLGRDPESVDRMLAAGVCSVFAKVLTEGPMKAQAKVAWAVSEFAGNYPMCQDLFAQNNVIRLLVGHLAFETTVQEHSKYTIPPTKVDHMSIHSAGISKQLYHYPQQQYFLTGGPTLKGGREAEDPATKAYMKAMAAKALWQLARGNAAICKIITDSKALLCFAVLLEKGPDEVKYNSAMALMDISRMAEKDADLRRSAFKPNYPAVKAVVDQVLRVVEKAESDDLLQPCITALGCLSRTFRATETRIIGPLVRLLYEREDHITREAVIALTKFACDENFLHFDHSKAIIAAGGPKHLVQLVYFGEQPVLQIEALVLLCYIAHNIPDDEALAQAEALTVLEWASKQSFMVQDPAVEQLLAKAKGRCNWSSTSPEVPGVPLWGTGGAEFGEGVRLRR